METGKPAYTIITRDLNILHFSERFPSSKCNLFIKLPYAYTAWIKIYEFKHKLFTNC